VASRGALAWFQFPETRAPPLAGGELDQ